MHIQLTLIPLVFCAFKSSTASPVPVPSHSPYSAWLADTIVRNNTPTDRHYVSAIVNEGLLKTGLLYKNTTLLSHVTSSISSLIAANGTLIGWDPTYYSLDDLRIGNNILALYNHTSTSAKNKTRYKTAADNLRKQLDTFPRTPTGGFWHRAPKYPNQMWLDGIYMAEPFYATYTSLFQPENTTAWEDIAHQFDLIELHCRNATSGLLVHGYDESHKAVWADPVTGASPHVWDRALGWYFMALVEVLQVYPASLSGYGRLSGYLNNLADALKRTQDQEFGGWWLVMDEPYPGMKGNYIESSGTAMFAYGFLKGSRTGLLDGGHGYVDVARKAYRGMVDNFVHVVSDGKLAWSGTVEVGSLDKNASYEYYISVPLNPNDGKGTGPFMFASTELEMLKMSGTL